MVIYPDAEIVNADWTKQSWDLSRDPAFWEAQPIDHLRHLVTIPAYDAAPPAVRQVIERRLADVAD